ncbi:MAG: hypothetical protein HY069_03865 [Chlamydiia bacterium]|nr:hypothetical protein [Chlamydiia bacterium]
MKSYAVAENYEELSPVCIKTFFSTLLILPFALMCKGFRTVSRLVGVAAALLMLVPTFGGRCSRAFFVERVSSLAKDLADWIVFPFAVGRCLVRCLLMPMRNPKI